jgi:hypothetical protein
MDGFVYEHAKPSLAQIRFFSREAARAGLEYPVDVVREDARPQAKRILAALTSPAARPTFSGWDGWEHQVQWALTALYADRQGHCDHWPTSASCWFLQPPPTGIAPGTLVRLLGHTQFTLLDFLGAYLNLFMLDLPRIRASYRDLSTETTVHNVDPPEPINAAAKAAAITSVRALVPDFVAITDAGQVLPVELAGTRSFIEGPVLDALDRAGWSEVNQAIYEAQDEVAEGHLEDAVTDVARALEVAFRLAGYAGNTLGDQVKSARRAGLFTGANGLLGSAADNVATWVSATRSSRSDAHDTPHAMTEADAALALRLALSVAAWLAASGEHG